MITTSIRKILYLEFEENCGDSATEHAGSKEIECHMIITENDTHITNHFLDPRCANDTTNNNRPEIIKHVFLSQNKQQF